MEGEFRDCSPLYAFSGLSIKASITISIWVRSVWVAYEVWKRDTLILTEVAFTYMVGPTELERERVHHFLDLQLISASGPENVKLEEMNCYSAFPPLFSS